MHACEGRHEPSSQFIKFCLVSAYSHFRWEMEKQKCDEYMTSPSQIFFTDFRNWVIMMNNGWHSHENINDYFNCSIHNRKFYNAFMVPLTAQARTVKKDHYSEPNTHWPGHPPNFFILLSIHKYTDLYVILTLICFGKITRRIYVSWNVGNHSSFWIATSPCFVS